MFLHWKNVEVTRKYGTTRLLTCTQVHAREQTAYPSGLALSFTEELNELAQEDAKSVGYAVHDHVAHETGEHHNPAVATIRWGRQVMISTVRHAVFVRGAAFRVSHTPTVRCERQPRRFFRTIRARAFALGLKSKKTIVYNWNEDVENNHLMWANAFN